MNTTFSPSNRPMVVGVFQSPSDAERAFQSLEERGYSRQDVTLLMSEEARTRYRESAAAEGGTVDRTLEGAGAGSAIGGTVGAAVAAIAAIGSSIVFPGLGLVVAGPIAAALAGAGAGGLTGGLVGALVGAGMPEPVAKSYDDAVRRGDVVLGVHPRSQQDADLIEQDWRAARGERIHRWQ